ncbi:MAG: hypothetical protein VCA55_01830 [Verrucomicrobiales bacterium]
MSTIVIIGLTLFLCSAGAIWVTLRASSDADHWRQSLRKRARFLRHSPRTKGKRVSSSPLADRRRLDKNARKLEGTTFFF